MTSDTKRPLTQQTQEPDKVRLLRHLAPFFRLPMGETLFVAAVLAAAATLRLALAARGWPYSSSDESTLGLMADDILWHGAHPAFFYGQHYLGSLDAYVQAPFFLIFGPTNFTLHLTSTVQMLLFLLLLYLFARAIYSPFVGGVAIALLAVGPGEELFYGMRVGVHAQDTLTLGSVLLGLVYLRLCRRGSARAKLALDLAIGLIAGLALWSTLLLAPFVLVAAVALGVEAWRSLKAASGAARRRSLRRQAMVLAAGLLIGLAPTIWDAITTPGAQLSEILDASGGPSALSLHNGVLGLFSALGRQIAGTLLFGLPSMFGNRTICAGCPLWPSPNVVPAPAEALRAALISTPFSLLFLGCWFLAAWPLARDVWRGQSRRGHSDALRKGSTRSAAARRAPDPAPPQPAGTLAVQVDPAPPGASTAAGATGSGSACSAAVPGGAGGGGFSTHRFDARWWGRMMLVAGSGLTLLVYVASSSSYRFVDTAPRYLVGLYLCTPLLVAPLCRGAEQFWRWLRARRHGAAAARPRLRALLAFTPLLALVGIGIIGGAQAWQQSANSRAYGVPAGARDRQMIAFLEAHHATRFYTTYWVCYRLMFDAQENIDCAVVSNTDALTPGNNRVPAYAAAVQATPHPAYVFDLTTAEVSRSVPPQISQRIAAGDPRFAGYTSANVGGYIVFYYAGP